MAINRTRKEINLIKESKDKTLKNILEMFNSPVSEWKRFKCSPGLSFEESVKTMRILPVFGNQN